MRNKKMYLLATAVFTVILIGLLSYISNITARAKFLNGRFLTDTVEISSETDFLKFIDSVNEGNQYNGVRVVLTNDLDFSDYEVVPQIGVPGTSNYFCGVFDGQGHEIHNITTRNLAVPHVRDALLSQDAHECHGLFLEIPGIICNLIIRNGTMICDRCEKNIGLYIAETNNASAGIYNCMTLSEYEFLSEPFTGESTNYFTNDEQDSSFINNFLKECSANSDCLLMNEWENVDNTLKMKLDQRIGIPNVYLTVSSREYNGDIYAVYKDNVYCIFVPTANINGSARINVQNMIGQFYSEKIELTGEDISKHISAIGEELDINIYYAVDTEAVIINTEHGRGISYVKADILHMPKGSVQILNSDGSTDVTSKLDYFRGRGNNSWAKTDKKGYKIKLSKDFDVLGMGAASDYFLISGSRDASLFTYKICEDLWRDMGFDYCRDNTIVNLYVDGEYQGAYLLIEAVEVGPGRIDINDLADLTGDYLYEIDNRYYRENPFNFSTGNNTYLIDNIHEPTKQDLEYSANFMKEYESAILNGDSVSDGGKKLSDLCDIESVAKQILAYEMISEWSIEQSVFWVKYSDYTGDGKLHALAPWDIEHSMLHTELDGLSIPEYSRAAGIYEALLNKPEIYESMKETYKKMLRNAMLKMVSNSNGEQVENDGLTVQSVDYYAKRYEQASTWNSVLWGEHKRFDNKASDVREFLNKKIGILDKFFEYEK